MNEKGIMEALQSLNTAQREAVTTIDGALLILAGAGSGKTKTLTTRLAYLLSEVGIPAQNTLTLTFTNKAAKEMRERAMKILESHKTPLDTMPLLCTFHKFGLLFLQRYIHVLARSSSFNVIDEDDKRKILRNLKKSHKHADTLPAPFELSSYISTCKNNAILPHSAKMDSTPIDTHSAEIYAQYEDFLCANNLVDFDDLLLLPYRILLENEDLRTQISTKYQYIMVDEYQDTNDLQANLLFLLCATHENLCVVGDDDQSIYSWRGANIANILEFGKQFSARKIVKLEQNYRSTKQILATANTLIAHNTDRYNKVLKTTKEGKEVSYIKSLSDRIEMAKIIESIQELSRQGVRYDEIAILFRLNALARNVEECCNRAKIPYKMIGVIRFYERQEIKDVLAYLRFALNPNDNFSLSRIINQPRRGIGEKTLYDLEQASAQYAGMYEAWKHNAFASMKCHAKLHTFFTLIESLRECVQTSLKELPNFFTTKIALYADNLQTKDSENNEERRQNIDEFFARLLEFIEEHEYSGNFENNEAMLQGFLNDIALSSSSDDVDTMGHVLCMSIHNSKGLEFRHVFVIGMEQGLFPLDNFDSQNPLNEERRLAYVAFTRAKECLTLSYAKNRLYRNERKDFEPSQFIIESGVASQKNAGFYFCKGDCVQHKIFGFGRIESVQGQGDSQRATINFGGTKRVIITSFLTKV